MSTRRARASAPCPLRRHRRCAAATRRRRPTPLNPPPTPPQVIDRYKSMKSHIQQLAQKISQLSSDAAEHELVLEQLADLEPERRAYRLVGGQLMQQTVADVQPTIKNTMDSMGAFMADLKKRQADLETQSAEWKIKYDIKTQAEAEAEAKAKARAAA